MRTIVVVFFLICTFHFLLAQPTKEEIYSKYINCNLNYFWKNKSDEPIFNGLKALILREYDEAEKILLEVIPSVSDSLKKLIYTDLAYLNFTQKNWSKGNQYLTMADSTLDPQENPYHYFSKYPAEFIKTSQDSISVELIDNFYIKGSLNDSRKNENLIVDTGASPSIISASLAQQYNLQIDSTLVTAKASGFGIPTNVQSTVIDKLTIGEVEFFNIPALIIGDEMFRRMGLKGEMIFGLTEMMMFDVVKLDYPGKKFILIRRSLRKNLLPNFAVLDFLPVINYQVRGETISGFIDTGSPITYLFTSEKFDPAKQQATRSIEKSWGEYKFTVNYYKLPLSFAGCLSGDYEIQIMDYRGPENRFEEESILGNDIWSDKVLVIDFRNNRICFE